MGNVENSEKHLKSHTFIDLYFKGKKVTWEWHPNKLKAEAIGTHTIRETLFIFSQYFKIHAVHIYFGLGSPHLNFFQWLHHILLCG